MVPIPLTDNVRRTTFWVSTLLLIVANVWVLLYELSLGPKINRLVFLLEIVRPRYTTARGTALLTSPAFLLPIFSPLFLHGRWLHLLRNMLFLYVFGLRVAHP